MQEKHARVAFDWFISLVGAEFWEKRRNKLVRHLKEILEVRSTWRDGAVPLLLGDEEDRFAWYLFLCESWLKHTADYEPMQGARVIPVMIALGTNLARLLPVDGVHNRAIRLATDERANPDSGLFELLVAACYARNGFDKIRFVPEAPPDRTHDLEVESDSQRLAVECKRLSKSSGYSLEEREHFWRMWDPLSRQIVRRGFSIGFDITFHVELGSLPSDFLVRAVLDRVSLVISRVEVFSDYQATIEAWPHNPGRVERALLSGMERTNPGRLKRILCGKYERDKYFAFSVLASDEALLVASVSWHSDAPDALRKKARHVLRHLAKAVKQLPTGRSSAVHIGLDALDGNLVEALRYVNIRQHLTILIPSIVISIALMFTCLCPNVRRT